MKKFKEKLESIFMAVAFAEAGEHETAASMAGIEINQNPGVNWIETLQNSFAAAAFAEADCPETALEFMGHTDGKHRRAPLEIFLETVGLQGVRVRYGVVTAG